MKRRMRNPNRQPFLPVELRPTNLNSSKRKQGLGEFDSDSQASFEASSGAEYDRSDSLPIDLFPYRITERTNAGAENDIGSLLAKIAFDTDMIAATHVLNHGLVGTSITIGTTPTRIIAAQFLKGYIIMNPSLVIGGSATGALVEAEARSTDGDSAILGVANYRDLHLFLNVTSVSGAGANLEIYSQALDPVSGNFADVQNIFSTISATGTYYANIGSLGLSTDFGVRWEITGTNAEFNFSIGYVVKEGLPGTGAGVGKTIYLGNSGVSTTSGFPLLEGQSRPFFLREGVELYAVAATPLDLRIFEL